MSTAAVLRARFPRAVANLRQYGGAAARGLDEAGQLTWFALTSIGQIAHALRYYRKETLRLIAQIGMGTGAMAVVGGTVAIVGFVTLSGSSWSQSRASRRWATSVSRRSPGSSPH